MKCVELIVVVVCLCCLVVEPEVSGPWSSLVGHRALVSICSFVVLNQKSDFLLMGLELEVAVC